jgi:hypothetical protein
MASTTDGLLFMGAAGGAYKLQADANGLQIRRQFVGLGIGGDWAITPAGDFIVGVGSIGTPRIVFIRPE